MRIMIDCRMLHGQKRGIEYYLEHLIHALASIDTRNDYTLFYVSGRADRSKMTYLPQPNFRTRILRFPNQKFVQIFQDSSRPYRWLRALSRGYDVVHEPGFEPLPLARRSVVTLHDLIFFRLADQMNPEGAAFYQRRQRESARNAAAVITDSEHTRRDAIELLGLAPEKVHTVHLGVSPSAFEAGISEAEARTELAALGVTRPFFLCIGDFYRRKNYITVLNAFAALPHGLRRDAQLVIAGAHVDQEVWAEMNAAVTSADLAASVLMPGYVSHAARRALMTRAVTLLYPSVYEGFGLPPLEAMACGVPTASADNTSIPEVVGDAGLLVRDFLEPDAWAEVMTQILTDEDSRRHYVAKGLERARTFTWERTARETLKVYELAARD